MTFSIAPVLSLWSILNKFNVILILFFVKVGRHSKPSTAMLSSVAEERQTEAKVKPPSWMMLWQPIKQTMTKQKKREAEATSGGIMGSKGYWYYKQIKRTQFDTVGDRDIAKRERREEKESQGKGIPNTEWRGQE